MRYQWIVIAIVALAAGPALAQSDKYDPNTGQYVTTDPFAKDAPPPDPSPYRLNPRVTGAVQVPGVPGANSQTPAANAAAAGGTSVAQQSQQLVPMDGMPMYGDASNLADPFAKPDWWPQ